MNKAPVTDPTMCACRAAASTLYEISVRLRVQIRVHTLGHERKKTAMTHQSRCGLVEVQNRVHAHHLQSYIHPLTLTPRDAPVDDTSHQRMLHPCEVKVINDLQSSPCALQSMQGTGIEAPLVQSYLVHDGFPIS
jgi:hypothetical protein